MLKRLIEVALPLREISEQSAREKSIRHGHISTLHIWWARRPLAACRAVVFASLIPDPDDPECPESFRRMVKQVLGRNEFKPKNGEGGTAPDTARNRCLEFIKQLVKWDNSNKQAYIEPARTLIAAAHKLLHPGAEGAAPKLLDPFAGGGAIPLEALRLGCEAQAVDLNPVAHLIELCTLVYPQKYGQPDNRSVPEYIKRLIVHNKARKKAKGGGGLFDSYDDGEAATVDAIIPDVEITEAEYRKNPLAADVKYWGHWVLEQARRELGQFYPAEADGSIPVAFLWARTVTCPNPTCGGKIPLIRQLWLCSKTKRKTALQMTPDPKSKACRFQVVEGDKIVFDPAQGTITRGDAKCPFCQHVAPVKYIREECKNKRMDMQMLAVVTTAIGETSKHYRQVTSKDEAVFHQAGQHLASAMKRHGSDVVPLETISRNAPRRVSPPLYGLDRFVDLFNQRQALALTTFCRLIRDAAEGICKVHDTEYGRAVATIIACGADKCLDFASTLCRWGNDDEGVTGTFGRQAIGMVWDFAESNPLQDRTGGFSWAVGFALDVVVNVAMASENTGVVAQGDATQLPSLDEAVHGIITDPPYYDAIPYSDLSDYFYVWLKRSVGSLYPDIFRTPLTPKSREITEQRPHRSLKKRKDKRFYEEMMTTAFSEMRRATVPFGIVAVMFAHKSTSAWEALIGGLMRSGLIVSASWPIHTEMRTRMVARNTASLASSVTLVCRKRKADAGDGHWDDVRKELQQVAKERLEFFWAQGIRGADFFISAIGPALSVFGKYERVTKLSGEEVTVGQFLDEVRGLVTNYALAKILKTTHTANIDSESRFCVVWKWSYGDAKVPADESFKLAQALGMNTEVMWDRTGVLEKSGENVQAMSVAKRMKIKGLGEQNSNSAPASFTVRL
jgi:adenine-specific DNA methylase